MYSVAHVLLKLSQGDLMCHAQQLDNNKTLVIGEPVV